MKKEDFSGAWYVPNGSNKYPGRLRIDYENHSILLEVFGEDVVEGTTINLNGNQEPQYFHCLILGECQIPITLYKCSWTGTNLVGKQLYRVRYKVEFVLQRLHIISSKDMHVRGGTFLFPSLASWYNGQSMFEKLPMFSDNKSINILRENATQETLDVTDNLSFLFFDIYSDRTKSLGYHYEMKYLRLLEFKYKQEVPIETLFRDASTFDKLLSFVRGKTVSFEAINFKFESNHIKTDNSSPSKSNENISCSVKNFSLREKVDVESVVFHTHDMLFSELKIAKAELNRIITKWFSNSSFYNIYDFYNDSNKWDRTLSNVMFNNRFLNLVQGLEDYHRKKIEQVSPDLNLFHINKQKVLNYINDDPPLKKWLNDNFKPMKYVKLEQKLEAIITNFNPLLIHYFGSNPILSNFPTYTTEVRNILSHGKNKETYQGEELSIHYHFAQLLLAICIMDTLEIDKPEKFIKGYTLLERNIQEIIFRTSST